MACTAYIEKGGYQNDFLRLTSCETAIILFGVHSVIFLYGAVFVGTVLLKQFKLVPDENAHLSHRMNT